MVERRTGARPHAKGQGMRSSDAGGRPALNGRIWTEAGGETVLSWGRVVLLERIRETGSLLKAARSMGMGYRHAWGLVDSMNRLSDRPLVEKAVGGREGGGSKLTPDGEAAVAQFWKLVAEFKSWLESRDGAGAGTAKAGRRR